MVAENWIRIIIFQGFNVNSASLSKALRKYNTVLNEIICQTDKMLFLQMNVLIFLYII